MVGKFGRTVGTHCGCQQVLFPEVIIGTCKEREQTVVVVDAGAYFARSSQVHVIQSDVIIREIVAYAPKYLAQREIHS